VPAQPGQTLSHYRLIEKIGEGGMGVVWKAVDTTLDREVAIKILSDAFAGDAERLGRFEREARVVASLSHPNIVTLHSVEEEGGLHFITMELVRGKRLSELTPRHGLQLDRFFELAIPLVDAVAAAHESGVTHRDLKPANVMVDDKGRLRVLDFGLAKAHAGLADGTAATQMATESVTREGRILGTVSYMSPEQAEGKAVDARSDIFSLGVMLYEMATGCRPFVGDTPVSTISSTLRDTPPPITELKQTLPRHLGRIVRRCLAKEPQRRYQTALDLRNELEELKTEVDSGELTIPPRPDATPGRSWARWLGLATAGVVLAIAGFAIREYLLSKPSSPVSAAGPQETSRIVPLTHSGTARRPALSPDGRYLVYVARQSGTDSLRVKQIATGTDTEIVPPGPALIHQVEVSPDGDYVFYSSGREDESSAIHRIPILGGQPRRIIEGVWNTFALSPDGLSLAVSRPEGDRRKILIFATDGGSPREIADLQLSLTATLAWTPDGKAITTTYSTTDSAGQSLIQVPVDGGESRPLGDHTWTVVSGTAWLPDGSGLLVTGSLGRTMYHVPSQVWHLSYPDLVLERVTRDLDDYNVLDLDRAGERAVVDVERTDHSIWVRPADGSGPPRRVAFSTQAGSAVFGPAWTMDGRLIFEDVEGRELHLWAIDVDGTTRHRLTTQGPFNMGASLSPDGSRFTYFASHGQNTEIWVSDVDGSGARRLSAFEGDAFFPTYSPDGEWIYHTGFRPESGMRVMRLSSAGGPSTALIDFSSWAPAVSPDGSRLAFGGVDPTDNRERIFITQPDGKKILQKLDPDRRNAGFWYLRWTPDGQGIGITRRVDGAVNLWVLPLDGGPPRQITHVDGGVVMGFSWSPDGGSLAYGHAESTSDIVLITGFKPARRSVAK